MNAQLKGEDFVSEDRLARVESEVKETRVDLNEFKLVVIKKFGEIDTTIEKLRGEMNTGFEKLRGEMNAGFEKIKRWALVAAGSMIVSAISILGRVFRLW